jgi:hypothetical protein
MQNKRGATMDVTIKAAEAVFFLVVILVLTSIGSILLYFSIKEENKDISDAMSIPGVALIVLSFVCLCIWILEFMIHIPRALFQ